ncbi:hypothetical protein CC2G_011954 [Coprinopsis cinerea AmutBmut pab1-1]|nr:hypothetical protein CC2G_011954 [Coprinopsis cinerea AmutBmut pab1-1]
MPIDSGFPAVANMKHWARRVVRRRSQRSPPASVLAPTMPSLFGLYRMKRWAMRLFTTNSQRITGVSAKSDATRACGHDLPLELIIEIVALAGRTSHKSYRNTLLISKALTPLMERACLPHLPIRLESTSKILSFHKLLVARPDLAQRVGHLWIKGGTSRKRPKLGYSEPTPATWRQFKASAFEQLHIIHSCTNLVSLACSFPVMFLCFRFTRDVFFHHDKLKELTLFENWDLWPCFAVDPPVGGPHLFLQLTHLTIVDCVAPQFPAHLFPSLKYFAAELYPVSRHHALAAFRSSKRDSEAPLHQDLRGLATNVNVMLHLGHNAELGVRRIVGDGREWSVRAGALHHFEWWAQRAAGGEGEWAPR